MADPSLFQAYLNNQSSKTPAFNFIPGVGFQPTEQSKSVIDLLNQASGKQFNLQPANSVMANEGIPLWGMGGGFVDQQNVKDRSTGYVDPLRGTVHTVAHEGAHAVLPSSLKQSELKRFDAFTTNPSQVTGINPLNIPRDSGQRLRWAHETYGKPALVEEAHAQGVAEGVLKKLNIPSVSSISEYKTPLDYPSTFVTQGIDTYSKNEIGPPSPAERNEVRRIFGAATPLMERVFNQGYNLIR
jgi:hypothetical protein